MWSKFKEFWTEYWDLCKESGRWMKKHWIGYIILCVVISSPYLIWYFHQSRKLNKEIQELRKQEMDRFTNR